MALRIAFASFCSGGNFEKHVTATSRYKKPMATAPFAYGLRLWPRIAMDTAELFTYTRTRCRTYALSQSCAQCRRMKESDLRHHRYAGEVIGVQSHVSWWIETHQNTWFRNQHYDTRGRNLPADFFQYYCDVFPRASSLKHSIFGKPPLDDSRELVTLIRWIELVRCTNMGMIKAPS